MEEIKAYRDKQEWLNKLSSLITDLNPIIKTNSITEESKAYRDQQEWLHKLRDILESTQILITDLNTIIADYAIEPLQTVTLRNLKNKDFTLYLYNENQDIGTMKVQTMKENVISDFFKDLDLSTAYELVLIFMGKILKDGAVLDDHRVKRGDIIVVYPKRLKL